MEFRLLGPLEALRDGNPIALGGAKPRALLTLLLLNANEVVSRDRLIDALWADRPPGTAEHSLDVQISRLRKAFQPEEVLRTRSAGYLLELEPEDLDARRFERLLEQGRRATATGKPAEALAAFDAALALWRGDALADVAYEDFARAESDRLEELRLVATEERVGAGLALGRHDSLVPEVEALVANHPLRERLREQLMLALYRSGRQAEALRVYGDTRMRLVDELGIEPNNALKELEQSILRQDTALDLPRTTLAIRRRPALVGALALAIAGVAVAAVVLVAQGGAERAQALANADSNVFLSAETGDVVRRAPVRNPVRVVYGEDALWNISSEGELTRLDSETGAEIARLGLGVTPSGLAVGANSVWITGGSSPTLYRIDPSVNRVVDEFPLPMDDVVSSRTGEVAVGAGSVWVGHGAENPGAWVERLDPSTGRVLARFSILAGDVDHLAYGEGALWVASSAAGELHKIDPRTNEVVFRRTLRAQLCCVAAGGGYVWAATNPDGVVWKVTPDGDHLPTIALSSSIVSLTYADGALWAALGDEGTIVRVDPTTDATRYYDIGHSVTAVDVHDGLVAVGVRQSVEDVAGDLTGDVVWIGRKARTLFDSGTTTDPAFTLPTWDAPQEMFHYATCARLLNYPDVEGEAGRRLVPEVAEAFPKVTDGGRTYTFRIRNGFRFSPPSGEEVTAESFRYALERVLSPKLGALRPPLTNIVGALAYNSGKAATVAGLAGEGDHLVIRFRQPQPDLPWLAGLSCAVPPGTPVVPNGLTTPVASAGPYYLAAHTDSVAVLKRNPNYGGTRPQHLDAIVFRLNIAPGDVANRIEEGTLDYFLESQNPTLRPDTEAAGNAGERYRLTPYLGIEFLAFNYDRPLFADIRMRRAVQYALDRQELADAGASTGLPATRLLVPGVEGYVDTPLYPVQADLHASRKLAAGQKGRVFVYTWNDPGYTDAFNRALREQLAAIGLRMSLVKMDQKKGFELAKAARSDLIWGGLGADTADPAAYLQPLYLPTQKRRDELRRLLTLHSPERERAAAGIVRRIEHESLIAVYTTGAVPELVSKRLGCIVHQPQYAGVDLAALCLRDGRD